MPLLMTDGGTAPSWITHVDNVFMPTATITSTNVTSGTTFTIWPNSGTSTITVPIFTSASATTCPYGVVTTTDGQTYLVPCNSVYYPPIWRDDDDLQVAPAIEHPPIAAPNIMRPRERPPDRVAAEARARSLLLETLTPEQRATFERNRWFVVEGGRSRQRYRINGGHVVANIEVLDREDRVTHRLCGHLRDMHPLGDHLLAQKIMLELDEERFLSLANRHVA
jgi:hypothetical protein